MQLADPNCHQIRRLNNVRERDVKVSNTNENLFLRETLSLYGRYGNWA